MTDSSRDVVAAGQKLYDETLKAQVEPLYEGKLLALDIATGRYEIGDDTASAFDRLMKKEPTATIYIVRVGDAAAVTLGSINMR